jgi:hypothetical protein
MQIQRIASRTRVIVTLVLCFGMGTVAPFARPIEVCLSADDASMAACCCPMIHVPAAPEPVPKMACCGEDNEAKPPAPDSQPNSDPHVGCTASATASADVDAFVERPRDERGPVVAPCGYAFSFLPVSETGDVGSATLPTASGKIPIYLLCATLRR